MPQSTNILWRTSARKWKARSKSCWMSLCLAPATARRKHHFWRRTDVLTPVQQQPCRDPWSELLWARSTKYSQLLVQRVTGKKTAKNTAIKPWPKVRKQKGWRARMLSLPLKVTLQLSVQVSYVNINFWGTVTTSTPLNSPTFSPSPHTTSHRMTNEFDPSSTPICSLSWLRHCVLPAFIKSDGLCVLRVPEPEEHRETEKWGPSSPSLQGCVPCISSLYCFKDVPLHHFFSLSW